MHDDIDWLNASSDFGLVQLCREMEAIAHPVERLVSLTSSRSRKRRSARMVVPSQSFNAGLAAN
jgi:hypothetical protein